MKIKLLSSLVLAGISVNALASDAFQCVNPVQSFSNLEQMMKGDFTANVQWKDVALAPNSIGYGPGEDHLWELTIVDGVVHMAQPGKSDSAVNVRTNSKPNEGAAMLQVANVKAWGKSEQLAALSNMK